jgi:hypothetical protein
LELAIDAITVYFPVVASLLVYTFLIGLALYVAKTWVRWVSSGATLTEPRWRSLAATIGLAASTFSLSLIIALAIHAVITGGFPYYSRPLMTAFRVGFLTALTGVLGALIGKGSLEVPAIISSILCLLIWFVEAVAQ